VLSLMITLLSIDNSVVLDKLPSISLIYRPFIDKVLYKLTWNKFWLIAELLSLIIFSYCFPASALYLTMSYSDSEYEPIYLIDPFSYWYVG
jgi:hypothetical protein